MKPKSTDIDLLENALLAIEKVLAHADSELREGRDVGSTIDLAEAKRFQASAAQSAANICLSAAAALVDVSKALMNAPGDRPLEDIQREWNALVSHTKIASRSAHRAALIMAAQDDALLARGLDTAAALPPLSLVH